MTLRITNTKVAVFSLVAIIVITATAFWLDGQEIVEKAVERAFPSETPTAAPTPTIVPFVQTVTAYDSGKGIISVGQRLRFWPKHANDRIVGSSQFAWCETSGDRFVPARGIIVKVLEINDECGYTLIRVKDPRYLLNDGLRTFWFSPSSFEPVAD